MPPGIVRRKRGSTMLNKAERTVEVYLEAGAYARLLYDIAVKAYVSLSKILPKKDVRALGTLLHNLAGVKSKADDQLFRDFPGIGDKGFDVFYGALYLEPDNELDEQVIRMAKEKAMALFGNQD